ncbi:MAG TPA: SMI1/KNR4 family protein [Polyangiales bacterium]
MATATRDELVLLLERIRECDQRFKSTYDRGQFRASASRANPPASEGQVQALCDALPFRLPPSYLELLRISDGIARFKWVDADLKSTAQLLADPGLDDWPERPELWVFIYGADTSDGVAFDRRTCDASGEMEVVELANYQEDMRHPSLSAFLRGYLARLESWLAELDDA